MRRVSSETESTWYWYASFTITALEEKQTADRNTSKAPTTCRILIPGRCVLVFDNMGG